MMKDLEAWMSKNNLLAFRAFSATDASDLPTGWTEPTKFTLEAVAVFDGKQMTLFTDEVHRMLIKDKSTKTMPLDSISEDFAAGFANKPPTLIGYGSSKFDLPLLRHHHPIFKQANHIDLSKIATDASEIHYGSYGRRYDLRSLATTNRRKQTAMPHLSLMMKPIALFSEWQRGLARNVIRTLAAEVELIAELYCYVKTREEIRIIDERTDRPVTVNCAFVRDVLEEE
jgi:hypothetical protein